MRGKLNIVLQLLCCGILSAAAFAGEDGGRRTMLFDPGWKFHLGEAVGAERADYDDSAWRMVNLPHDWSIEGPVGSDPNAMDGPFDRKSPGGKSSAFLNGGIGWYRKHFTIAETAKTERIFMQFDGAFMNSEVWINGKSVGVRPYGYSSFQYDITPFVKFGSENVVSVRLNVQPPCSRWYTGAGLYRHVWLISTGAVHVGPWGTYITTPKVGDSAAQVSIRTMVCNDSNSDANTTVETTIFDSKDKEIVRGRHFLVIAPGAGREARQNIEVKQPQLWSTEQPNLYKAVTQIYVDAKLTDNYTTTFGIRTIEFTADKGFLLNGKHVPIYGLCLHHTQGCLGAAAFRRGFERQLELLKGCGCNAIRTAHNPPSPELLELCDKMGFLVMEEAFDEWKISKLNWMRSFRKLPETVDYNYYTIFDQWSEADLADMIRRDRNHPGIILWSIGNEIFEQEESNGGQMAKRLADICHREDPTRPVTAACHQPETAIKTGFADALDVFGLNYHIEEFAKQRGKIMVGTEDSSGRSSRCSYNLVLDQNGDVVIKDRLNNQSTAYSWDLKGWDFPPPEATFKALKKAPWVAGQFVWTGFDYFGEPTPFEWPSYSSSKGIFDNCGFAKDRFYLHLSQWSDKPMVHILPHWDWQQFMGKKIPVRAYSNCETVELFVNGKSLGERSFKDTNDLHLSWSVPFAPGVLKAVGKKNGQNAAEDTMYTAGQPARLEISTDRKVIDAGGQDLSFITIRILDKDGHICPEAGNIIKFKIEGAGILAGLDNGDTTDHEFFQGTQHKAYGGLALAVIRSIEKSGEITLTASSEGLGSASVKITSR